MQLLARGRIAFGAGVKATWRSKRPSLGSIVGFLSLPFGLWLYEHVTSGQAVKEYLWQVALIDGLYITAGIVVVFLGNTWIAYKRQRPYVGQRTSSSTAPTPGFLDLVVEAPLVKKHLDQQMKKIGDYYKKRSGKLLELQVDIARSGTPVRLRELAIKMAQMLGGSHEKTAPYFQRLTELVGRHHDINVQIADWLVENTSRRYRAQEYKLDYQDARALWKTANGYQRQFKSQQAALSQRFTKPAIQTEFDAALRVLNDDVEILISALDTLKETCRYFLATEKGYARKNTTA